MARNNNWSKDRDRSLISQERAARAEIAALLNGPPQAALTKEELRLQAAEALANYNGRVTRLPTIVQLRCICGHRGKVAVADRDKGRKFKCSNCGARL